MHKKLFILFSIFIFLSGCESTEFIIQKDKNQENVLYIENNEKENVNIIEKNQCETIDTETLNTLNIDESQEIMVLMYHNIGETESTWTRTPENFRKDLETLYNNGFRAISLEQYVKGDIVTEIGYTPVVITFDDGNENNFKYIDNNEIDPKSAIGIMEQFKIDYPDFNITATFFLNRIAFGNSEQELSKLNYLISNGYSIGNHTLNHKDLSKATSEEIQIELSSLIIKYKGLISDIKINTLALPYGSKPDIENYLYTYEGSINEISYNNIAVLLVGWDPYLSPFHKDFDFSRIRRVRASETNVDGVGLYDWLNLYEKGSKKRFISDGNKYIISIPQNRLEIINTIKFPEKKLITY